MLVSNCKSDKPELDRVNLLRCGPISTPSHGAIRTGKRNLVLVYPKTCVSSGHETVRVLDVSSMELSGEKGKKKSTGLVHKLIAVVINCYKAGT